MGLYDLARSQFFTNPHTGVTFFSKWLWVKMITHQADEVVRALSQRWQVTEHLSPEGNHSALIDGAHKILHQATGA